MKTININVTQACIDRAIRSDCRACPIALAAMMAMPDADIINVGSCVMTVVDDSGDNVKSRYVLPNSARNFIQQFDCNLPVKPFSFTIEL
jgi:hypothetical protein